MELTPKEAITVIRNLQDWLYFSSMNGGTKIQREALDIAVNAIEKQIPKKPIHVRTFENLDLAFYKCPNCGFIRRKDLFPQYCEFCGQAIDGSEL